MLKRLLLLVLLFAGLAQAAPQQVAKVDVVPTVNKDRALVLGEIDGRILRDVAVPMIRMAQTKPGEPIDLIISSPGGMVTTGFVFINIMEAIKTDLHTPIRCFVPTMAASMAFQILTHCSERYALSHAFLLWHRVRIVTGNTPLTSVELAVAARDLAKEDSLILLEVLKAVDMDPKEVLYHFNNETLHVASQLAQEAPKFIKAYDAIPGLMNTWLPPNQTSQSQDKKNAYAPGTIIYKYEER